MHWHLREHALRLVHVAIFAALVLRGWCNRTCSAVHRSSISIAQRWSLARAPPLQQPLPQRGKQPRPPQTVAVVLADDCSNIKPLDQLAAVLTWCLRRDIQALLVYHPQGVGVGQLQTLSSLISSSFPAVKVQAGFGEPCSNCQHSSECLATASADSSQQARVHMLDANDAVWPLVCAARVDQQQCSALESSVHPTAALHSQMTRAAGQAAAAEPDIVLVFGKSFTLAGFPPWLLRFCELYHLGQLSDVTDERLDTTLQKYNNVAQRFGI